MLVIYFNNKCMELRPHIQNLLSPSWIEQQLTLLEQVLSITRQTAQTHEESGCVASLFRRMCLSHNPDQDNQDRTGNNPWASMRNN